MQIKLISYTPTISASSAYSSGDAVGGKATLTSALGANNKGILRSIVVVDMAAQGAALTIQFFSADPSNTTFTDNGALDIHDTDAATAIGMVKIATTDYQAYADNTIACKSDLFLPLEGAAQTIYAGIITTGTPTYAATDDLRFKFYFEV